jgi:hypothetical protein
LYVIDSDKIQVLAKENFGDQKINREYFLSPTNLALKSLLNVFPIASSDSVLALGDENSLMLVSYSEKSKKISKNNISNSLRNETLRVESFKTNQNLIILYNKDHNKLFIANLDEMLMKLQFDEKSVLLVKTLKKGSIVEDFGLSSDNKFVYLIENKKTLRFICLENGHEIMASQFYSPMTSVLCSSKYICMSMVDNRVLSYIITDSSKGNVLEEIKKLPSRSLVKESEHKRKCQAILNKCSNLLDNSSDDEEDAFVDDLFNKEESRSNDEFAKMNFRKFKKSK